MRKKLIALITLVLALVLSVSALSGCNLVTTDTDADVEQVVATVQLDPSAKKEEIKKREMVMAYLSYGYSYVASGNYTAGQVFEMILENLINSRIMVQSVIMELDADETYIKRDGKDKWDAERYLTDEDMLDAKYQTIKSMNDFIDGYDEDKTDKRKGDTYSEEVRTKPSDAENKTAEKTDAEKQAYIDEFGADGADIGTVGSNRRKAYNKFLKLLENNGFLGSEYKNNLTETSFYKQTYSSEKENLLIKEYEKHFKNKLRKEIEFDGKTGFEALEAIYAKMYEDATNKSSSTVDFESALSSATATAPIVYNPTKGTYSYVYNLLLGASDKQSELISALSNKLYEAERAQKLNDILSATVVKDLRSSWILSGYDFDYETKKFTGDYIFASEDKTIPFQGEVTQFPKVNEDDSFSYRIDSIKEFGIDEFLDAMDIWVYGESKISETVNEIAVKKLVNAEKSEEYDAIINDLLFAFSTDPGSLNTYKGYTITPSLDIGGTDTYVKAFAKAGRILMDMINYENYGSGSYIVVATDYGYHVMFMSELLKAETGFATLTEYLDEQAGTTGTDWEEVYNSILNNFEEDDVDTNSFIYKLIEIYSDATNALNNKESDIIAKYKHDSSKVIRYKNAYNNLINE